MDTLDSKRERLRQELEATGGVMVAFSGGADSTFLLAAAAEALGDRAVAATGVSPSLADHELTDARLLAGELGVRHVVVATHELQRPGYAANGPDRCYFCKSELWSRLAPIARGRGMTLLDGTNADDLSDFRPGARAAREHGVRSPLAELGFAKDEIRALSARLGLPTWSQPSAPCLSSRLPYGTAVTPARLAQVEAAEAALRRLGITGDLRVRHHGEIARVELAQSELDAWLEPGRTRALGNAVRAAGFRRVVVDLRGFRSGSLNVLAGVVPD